MNDLIYLHIILLGLAVLALAGIGYTILLIREQTGRAYVIDTRRIADYIISTAITEFKSNVVGADLIRPYAFTQYTLICAEYGLPRAATAEVVQLVVDALDVDIEPMDDVLGENENFLFDGAI